MAPDNDNTLFSRKGFFELPNQMGKKSNNKGQR